MHHVVEGGPAKSNPGVPNCSQLSPCLLKSGFRKANHSSYPLTPHSLGRTLSPSGIDSFDARNFACQVVRTLSTVMLLGPLGSIYEVVLEWSRLCAIHNITHPQLTVSCT